MSTGHLASKLAIAIAAVCCLSACSETEPGELMVVVTTDMAVPTDIDSLRWSVTLPGAATPHASGTFGLESAHELPATLSIVDGPVTNDAVTVRIEGYKGETLRVAHEARVQIPVDRVARLDMPLSWLCSEAVLGEPCAKGLTCAAGECVDARRAEASLPDYLAAEPVACREMSACFFNKVPIHPDSSNGACTYLGTDLGDDADVNLAITVNTAEVGAYGFCDPRIKDCFIPLRRGTPEGWQVINSVGPVIEFPPAVCDADDPTKEDSVSDIAVFQPQGGCPADRGDFSLCTPEERCLEANTCPSGWSSWVGYACSGAASPYDQDEAPLYCRAPAADPEDANEPVNGRWCCATGADPSEDPWVIDDMLGGSQIKITPPVGGQIAGFWWTTLGPGRGDLNPAPDRLFTYRTIDPPVKREREGLPDITRAACLKSEGFLGYSAIMGIFMVTENARDFTDVAFDVSANAHAGISFWGWAAGPIEKAPPLDVKVAFPNVDTASFVDSACRREGMACDDHFHVLRPLYGHWEPVVVRWKDLHQSNADWDPPQYRPSGGFDTRIYNMQFEVRGPGGTEPFTIMGQPFDICVADLRFIDE